jgi:hypothetical protein
MKLTISLLAFGAVSAVSALSFAYCQTNVCDAQDPPSECDTATMDDSGCLTGVKVVAWPKNCTSFSVQVAGSTKLGITADELQSVVRTAFDNWQNATCSDGRHPNINIETFPQVECNESRYNKNGPNQNVWMFRDDAWPHKGDGERTIALTLVQFGAESGEIYDVDVELNSYARTFTLESGGEGDDLYSVVQHESGHFLGLAHSFASSATMFSYYDTGVEMRTLEADDEAGICAAYPPVDNPEVCDTDRAEPRHGFSTQCSRSDSGCSFSPWRAFTSVPVFVISFLLFGGLGFRRRTRKN